MEQLDARWVQLELKYCERCGGLWLRLRGSELIFCAACAKALAGLWPHSRRALDASASACVELRRQFWSEGGNA